MNESFYPHSSRTLAEQRRTLAPEAGTNFQAFSTVVFKDGALPTKPGN